MTQYHTQALFAASGARYTPIKVLDDRTGAAAVTVGGQQIAASPTVAAAARGSATVMSPSLMRQGFNALGNKVCLETEPTLV